MGNPLGLEAAVDIYMNKEDIEVTFLGHQTQLVPHGSPNLVSRTVNSISAPGSAPWALGYPVKNLG